MAEMEELEDYVWHFRLTPESGEPTGSDALSEMVRRELEALLGCVALTKGGVPVRVDGFRFLGEAGSNHQLFSSLGDTSVRENR